MENRMKHLDLNSTIGDWLSERPQTCHVFEFLKLDCPEEHSKPLQQKCWERRLSPLDVLAQLHDAVAPDRQVGKASYDRSIGSMETVPGG
jgi:hypothetical protein